MSGVFVLASMLLGAACVIAGQVRVYREQERLGVSYPPGREARRTLVLASPFGAVLVVALAVVAVVAS